MWEENDTSHTSLMWYLNWSWNYTLNSKRVFQSTYTPNFFHFFLFSYKEIPTLQFLIGLRVQFQILKIHGPHTRVFLSLNWRRLGDCRRNVPLKPQYNCLNSYHILLFIPSILPSPPLLSISILTHFSILFIHLYSKLFLYNIFLFILYNVLCCHQSIKNLTKHKSSFFSTLYILSYLILSLII